LQERIFSEKLRHIFMNKQSKFWKLSAVSFAVAVVVLGALSCGHPTGSGQVKCLGENGDEFCACLAGNTCNNGLSCAVDRNLCVTGTGGITGAAGTTGTAGTTGSAGVSGGAGTTGTAGTIGTGGPNLIVNGDFSNGMTNWAIPNGTPTSPGVMNGQFCLTLVNNAANVIVGWGDASTSVVVNQGTSYTLSYQASSSAGLSTFEAHVGQVVQPYNVDFNAKDDKPGTGLTTFTHIVTVTTSDAQAGLAFVMAASSGTPKVCLDNVSLTAEN
jgi:hypothetical protein